MAEREYVIRLYRLEFKDPFGFIAGFVRAPNKQVALERARLIYEYAEPGTLISVQAQSECTPSEREQASIVELLLAWRRMDKDWAKLALQTARELAANAAAKGRRT